MGGQSVFFLNLFVVAAAYLLARHLPPLQMDASRSNAQWLAHGAQAMLLCGIAIQIKTTAAFPGAFLGMTLIFMAHRAGWPYARILGAALLWAFIGLLPTIGAGVWYAVHGPDRKGVV